MPNRLSSSTSPYLQQHADNPVDWWEWSEEAFAAARARDVPVFVSIGYSACHWCHVMAHESFEDPEIARLLNDHFVSIKVDREERPDIDSIYMEATVAMTGHGGWPMSVFVDHEGRPFYTGTYFPPEPRHGMPSFPQVLMALSESWRERRGDIDSSAGRIVDALNRRASVPAGDAGDGVPDATVLTDAVNALVPDFDPRFGGFGGAPKFPPSMVLEFLIRYAAAGGSAPVREQARAMVEKTLDAMARGGIHDQLGGGFARYSVDDKWIVPHFEKMLYDNALLLRVYLHWWRLTGSVLAERVVRETAEFLVRDMRTPEGGFAAALDADSEGVEGKFYSWTPEQLVEVLGEADGAYAAELLSVTATGTFEHGASTLQLLADPDSWERWRVIRERLWRAREERVHPGRDDKVVAAWNGLAIAALAEAGALLDEPAWVDAASAAADLLISLHLVDGDDEYLLRTSRDGVAGRSLGVLDDYGDVAEGLLALYWATGEDEWLTFAGMVLDIAVTHFTDGEGGFYDTADFAEELMRRPREAGDNAEPSGWFAVANALVSYAAITESMEHRERALAALPIVRLYAERAPRSAGWGLVASIAALDGPAEVTVSGVSSHGDAMGRTALVRAAQMSGAPGAVIRYQWDSSDRPWATVCRHFVCGLPVHDPEVLRMQLSDAVAE